MPATQAQHQTRIDDTMDQASEKLVARDYFAAERLCVTALRKAMSIRDYDRLARIVLPLQEARRQKRDLALDAGAVFLIDGDLPTQETLLPGCYLISPPRVGVDGRALRDLGDEMNVPVLVLVREPTTRDGSWPLVAVGPMTIRAKVRPPMVMPPDLAPAPAQSKPRSTAKSKKTAPAPVHTPTRTPIPCSLPSPEWFMAASESLGDAAIASAAHITSPDQLVEALMLRLDAHPDHEKLHQRLMDAARAAARLPARKRRPSSAYDEDPDAEDTEL